MKKWFILVLVVAAICVLWYYLRTYVRYEPEWDKAKFGEITRGDIRVPITASGLIDASPTDPDRDSATSVLRPRDRCGKSQTNASGASASPLSADRIKSTHLSRHVHHRSSLMVFSSKTT